MNGRRFGLTAIVAFALATSGQASAEIVELDCGFNGQIYMNVWVDFDKSVVTVKVSNPSTPTTYINTYSALIAATSISWRNNTTSDGLYFQTFNIDRTTGDLLIGNFGPAIRQPSGTHYQCSKGTTPLPATKF